MDARYHVVENLQANEMGQGQSLAWHTLRLKKGRERSEVKLLFT